MRPKLGRGNGMLRSYRDAFTLLFLRKQTPQFRNLNYTSEALTKVQAVPATLRVGTVTPQQIKQLIYAFLREITNHRLFSQKEQYATEPKITAS